MALLQQKRLQTYLFLFVVSFILYANTITHEYAWDDKIVIEKNPHVQKGISGIPDLFVKHNSLFQYDKYGYRPITLVTFALDYTLSKGNPHFSHFMNAFYYAVLSVLIFIFLTSLFSQYHWMFSLLISLLFITHPLHTEVVANIKSRDEILSFLFSILSFIFFIRFLANKKALFILYAFLSYLLAYLCKENSITMVAVFPLILFIKKIRLNAKTIAITSVSLIVCVAISLLIYTLSSSSTSGIATSAGKGIYEENGILGNSFFHLSGLGAKLPNAIHVLGLYLKNFILPYPLLFYYGYNVIPVTGWGNFAVIASLLIHLLLVLTGIKFYKARPEILFGFLFYSVAISIYTHLFRTLSDTMADRFLFFGSLGLCILLVGLLGLVFKINWTDLKDKKLKLDIGIKEFAKQKSAMFYGVVVASILLSFLTFSRNKVWKNDMTLVKNDLPYLENSSRVHYYYASLLNKQLLEDKKLVNNPQKRKSVEDEMVKHYTRSFEISDYAYLSYLELGNYYCRYMRYDEGLPILEKGLKLFPDAPDLLFYVGQTYVLIHKDSLAIPLLEKGIQYSYNQASSYYFLSLAYSGAHRYNDAIKTATEGLSKFENEKGLFYDAFGFIYFDHNELDKSIEYTFKLKDYGKPEKDVYSYVIGRCYAKGDTAKGNFYRKEAELKGIVFQ